MKIIQSDKLIKFIKSIENEKIVYGEPRETIQAIKLALCDKLRQFIKENEEIMNRPFFKRVKKINNEDPFTF